MFKNFGFKSNIDNLVLAFFIVGLIFLIGFYFGDKASAWSNADNDYMELKDLVDSISLSENEEWTRPSPRFLASPGTKVHWNTRNIEENPGPKLVPWFGSEGRTGHVNVRMDGRMTTTALDSIVVESPWTISWMGSFKFVDAIMLAVDVDAYDMDLDVPGYLERLGWATRMTIDKSLNQDCSTSWYEIVIPGRKKMWMNVIKDYGNSYGMLYITFVFEDISEFDVCKKFYKDDK